MSQLFEVRGSEFKGSIDQIVNETVTDARAATAVLAALNAEAIIDIQGKSVCLFDVRTAAGALTLVFEGTIDGVNYFALPSWAVTQNLAGTLLAEEYVPSIVIATTCTGLYTVGTSGFRRIRVRVSAYTSGNVTVGLRAAVPDFIIYDRPIPATKHVTVTAAANTAATATLPAAGVGMFHYITSIQCYRNATAALAGTATLIITSTNLPGNPAWSVGNNMIAGGTQADLVYEPHNPLKSLVANTNTTIVMPAAGAAVLNRINVSYFVGF